MTFHINPNSGATGVCKAVSGSCPFGGSEAHFETAAEARGYFERVNGRLLFSGEKRSLKSLTTEELFVALFEEAEDAGFDVAIIQKAAEFAKELHVGQFRSAPSWEEKPDYIVHPLRNAIRLIRWGSKDQNVILAGLLHDTVEDCSEKYCIHRSIEFSGAHEARQILLSKISEDYGPRVADIVFKLSNPIADSDQKQTISLEKKNQSYSEHVKRSIASDFEVLSAKLSDLHDNAASLIYTNHPERFAQNHRQALKYSLVISHFSKELSQSSGVDPELKLNLKNSVELISRRLKMLLESKGSV